MDHERMTEKNEGFLAALRNDNLRLKQVHGKDEDEDASKERQTRAGRTARRRLKG
jgi:hypothetical protein